MTLLSAEALARIDRGIEAARSLPSQAYTCPVHFERELSLLFRRGWIFVLGEAEIPGPGDMVPLSVAGGVPVVVLRDRKGTVRAYHNVCKHRGVDLVPEPVKGRPSMICRYHGWVYDLDGKLVRAPHYSGFDIHEVDNQSPACLALTPIRCESWNGLIFLDLGGDAEPLAEHLAPLSDRWRDYDLSTLQLGGRRDYRLKANWKLAIENYLDSYHNPYVHPALNAASLWEEHYNILEDGYFGVASYVYDPATAGHAGLPRFPGLDAKGRTVAEYPVVLPNLLLGVHPDYLMVVRINPISAEEVEETFYFYFVGAAAMAEDLREARERVMDNWHVINVEDIGVVEGLQVGRRSPAFADGGFSPFHEPVAHHFHRKLARRLGEGL